MLLGRNSPLQRRAKHRMREDAHWSIALDPTSSQCASPNHFEFAQFPRMNLKSSEEAAGRGRRTNFIRDVSPEGDSGPSSDLMLIMDINRDTKFENDRRKKSPLCRSCLEELLKFEKQERLSGQMERTTNNDVIKRLLVGWKIVASK